MTTEQLLRKRYRVAIPYPGSIFTVGQIVEKHPYANGKHYIPNLLEDPDRFPEIFQPLPWWKDRMPEDMPKYYKHKDFGWVSESIGIEGTTIFFQGRNDSIEWHVQHLLPATKEEYDNYINQKEVKNG